MSTITDTPSKPPRRSRRSQRNLNGPPNSTHNNTLPREILSRQTKSDLDFPDKGIEAPSTPPPSKARSRVESPGQRGSISAGESSARKKTPKKHQGHNKTGSSPMPRLNSTPKPMNRSSISLTPGRKSSTPSQAYAGPTFHASPAASSLPIPKFYSKSVPEVNKSPSVQDIMENEGLATSSDQSGDSPTPGFAQRVGEQQAREESPLDIFFKADREEKERQRKQREEVAAMQANKSTAVTKKSLDIGLPNDRPSNHTRQSTHSSIGGFFPMEMGVEEPANASYEKVSSTPTPAEVGTRNSYDFPENIQETAEELEQRRAKTAALKKLLLYSAPEAPRPSDHSDYFSEDTELTAGLPGSQPQKRPASSPMHNQIAARTVRHVSPRPRPSSGLRQEFTPSILSANHYSNNLSELPASPTPARTRATYESVPMETKQGPRLDGNIPSFFTNV